MRALIQRVVRAAVRVIDDSSDALTVGEIGPGLCVFVGVTHDDDESTARRLADKVWNLRVFDDDEGVMNRALSDGCGDVLVVSQFTLYADTSKGRRPSWIAAARPEVAEPLVDVVVESLRGLGATVETGRFRTEMHVELVNDGPVTIVIET
ncbi:MAG TPA: D-aminoacyl-tRNA deacylase [Ilumatobacteraceae bacterium]|nr:D-aminoacyl-tRNA deacylase [Ilumatobacteraceae bacterium]